MIIWEDIKEDFGDWDIKKAYDRGILQKIYDKLKEDSGRNKEIFPDHKDTFRALRETKFRELRCVMLGLSPYSTLHNKKIIADGLCMSTRLNYLPPSLENFYSAIEKEYNTLNLNRSPDLTYLAHQGILVWNISLTTEKQKPTSHVELWREFQKYFFEEIISLTGVPVIALGNEAAIVERWLAPMQWFFRLSHPVSSSYKGDVWESKGVFKKLNQILKDNNKEEIIWKST